MMQSIPGRVMLAVVALMVLRGLRSGDAYGAFVRGAKRGMDSALQLLPALCAMQLMLSMLDASGLTAMLSRLLRPLTGLLNLPEETAPLLLLRPLTGSGSLSVLKDIFTRCGVDSRAGRAAAVMMGSSETIVYTMTVYLAATDVRRLPWTLPVSLLSYLAGVWVCGLMV
ncbi:MAG: nucleoside recognition domain-containing protein [Aristaeellaceae bacterium]